MNRSLSLTDELVDYIWQTGVREHPALARCRAETASMPMSIMQISPEQGAFMALLVKLIGAKRTLEIGTFTGYSALAVALALPDDGRVVACDINDAYIDRARSYWRAAGVMEKIEVRLAPAGETLSALAKEAAGKTPFDFAFIDADKTGYDVYYEACLKLVRSGGLIAVDNVLWGGQVADPANRTAETEALRALNRKIRDDDRVDMCLAPLGDGIMLARRR